MEFSPRAAELTTPLESRIGVRVPVIHTRRLDVSAYIPTNVIYITDGQICSESFLF